MTYFLVIYNRPAGELLSITTFDDGRQALAARLAEEDRLRDPDVEVVVLSAASEAELKRTHARYFQGPTALISHMIDQEEPPEARRSESSFRRLFRPRRVATR